MTSLIVKIGPNSMYQPIIAYDTAQLERVGSHSTEPNTSGPAYLARAAAHEHKCC